MILALDEPHEARVFNLPWLKRTALQIADCLNRIRSHNLEGSLGLAKRSHEYARQFYEHSRPVAVSAGATVVNYDSWTEEGEFLYGSAEIVPGSLAAGDSIVVDFRKNGASQQTLTLDSTTHFAEWNPGSGTLPMTSGDNLDVRVTITVATTRKVHLKATLECALELIAT